MPSISSPQSTLAEVNLDGVRYVVLLGPEDGSAPTRDNEAYFLQLLSYSRSAGGTRLDAGKLQYRLDLTNQRLMDIASPLKFHRQIEIRRLDEDGEPTIVESCGFLAIIAQEITGGESGGTESLTLDFRIDPFMFGQPLLHTVIWDYHPPEDADPLADPIKEVHWPFVFNPEIDRIVEPNRSKRRETAAGDEEGSPTGPHVFVSPESIRTGAAILAQDNEVVGPWKLSEAVQRLCVSCNPDETWITNPTLDELRDAFGSHDDEVKNHHCPFGQYLPQLLDDLLRKHGFGWYLTHELDGTDEDESRITKLAFYRRGEGVKAQLLMNRPGIPFSFKTTNVASFRHSVNLVELANKIIARSGKKRRESTLPLFVGWVAEYDHSDSDPETERGIETLARDHAFGKDHPEVGRQFVLNEAGDFCDDSAESYRRAVPYPLNDELYNIWWNESVDFEDPLPGQWAVVRRRFWPCISRQVNGDDKQSYGTIVEWWDRDAEDADTYEEKDDPGWTKVKGTYRLLEHQCGISFEEPPGYLWERWMERFRYAVDGDTPDGVGADKLGLFLRITASIDGDDCLEAIASKRDSSPQGEEIAITLTLDSKFHFRKVMNDSILKSKPNADEIDDTERLEDYAEQVRDLEDAGDVSCSITLSGTDHAEWEIGKLVDKINGRNITLTANNPEAQTPRALQIVGLNYQLVGGQTTELLLETFKQERPVL